jgi:hypothetical protein
MRSATAALSLLIASVATATPSIVTVREITLPLTSLAVDVRWATDKSVFLADLVGGVVETDLARVENPAQLLAAKRQIKPQPGPTKSLFMPEYIAASRDYIAVAAPIWQIAWKTRNGGEFRAETFAAALDIDVWKDSAVLYGVRGDATAHWGNVGPTLWLLSFNADQAYFKPITASPPEAMHKCAWEGIGAVRFFPDGRFIYVPGVEPGMELYDSSGRLIRRWSTEPLGVDDHCRITDAQSDALVGDIKVRYEWMNHRQIVDEVLPLVEGPLVIVRQSTPRGTAWHAFLVPFDGDLQPVAIPITSPSKFAHLHADLKGDRIIFLAYEMAMGTPHVDTAARLITARVVR